MSKKVRLLAVLLLVATMLPISAMPSAAGPNPKVKPHEQPFGEGGALGIAAWATFDNPNYYYAPITSAPSGVYYRQAGLSPDGTKIVAVKTWTEGSITRREVVLMNADGTGEVVISPGDSGEGDIYQYGNPFWSDDGTAVGYVEVHNSNPNKVVRYDLATSTRTYIYEPTAPDDVANPDFLGASKTAIVFWDYGAGGSVADLFIWDGTTRTNITNTADYKEYEPVSNGDGTKIVYWSGETTTEPVDHTHTLTYSGGVWVKDLDFTPIPGSYWSYWTTPAATHIATTMITDYSGTIDLYLYDATGAFVADLTGPGYTGGAGQWNFFGCMPLGPNGEFVITSNAGRVDPGRDIVIAAPRASLYVDDDGSDSNPGTEAAPFATIQKGVDEAIAGGTVNVAAGTYVEQVEITKNLTLQGVGSGTIIQSPDVLTKKFTTSADNKPIVYIHDADTVTVKDLVVDGAGKGNANYRFSGIAYYNAGGTVDNVEIKEVRDTPWSGTQHGVALYAYNGDSASRSLTVTHCNVHDFQKNGMALVGTGLTVNVSGNTVTGYGPTNVTAQNCIQVSSGASGTVSGNNVSGVSWLGPTWTASAILVTYADVDVTGNTVSEGQTGIYFWGGSGTISGNNVTASDTGIGREDFWGIIAGDPPMALPSPFDGGGPGAAGVRAMGTLTINVTDNTITGSGGDLSEGLEIPAGYEDESVEFTATGNTIIGWGYGVAVYKCTSECGTGDFASLALHQNSIYGNTHYGMYVDGMTSDVDAELNYWGAETGPYHATENPNGEGDTVSDYVDFSPWLGLTPGTDPMTYGVIPGDSIGDAIALMDPGDTLILMAGNHPGGITIAKGITLRGEPGAIIGPGSDGITVSANDVTIEDVTLDGTGGGSGDVGIRVLDGVERLHIEGCEIRNWPDDGIHFNGAITGLKVVDNYIHDNGGDGMEFNGSPAGTVQIYGNALRANTGSGVNAASGSVVAEYNEWGDIAGPTGTNGDGVSGSVDYDPWVFGAVYADVVPDPAQVREGENVDVDIKVDTANLYGAQFSLTFDPAKLQVVSTTDEGSGYFKGSQECSTTYNNTLGTLTFYCSRGGTDTAVSGSGVKLLTITFQAQEISGTSTDATIDLDTASVKLGAVGGVNIYVDSVTDDSLTIYGTTDVSGVVDLQGRANDSGAVVTFPAGVLYPGGTDTTDSWGRYDFAGVTDGSYLVTIEMARYLDASAAVNVAGDTLTLNTVMLLGGDADDSDKIDISDLSIIGGQFGKSGGDITDTRADINNDNTVDILDIVLAAGNYDLSSSPWTP